MRTFRSLALILCLIHPRLGWAQSTPDYQAANDYWDGNPSREKEFFSKVLSFHLKAFALLDDFYSGRIPIGKAEPRRRGQRYE